MTDLSAGRRVTPGAAAMSALLTGQAASPVLLVLASVWRGTVRRGQARPLPTTQTIELCLQQAVLSGLPVVALIAESQLTVAARWLARRDIVALPDMGDGTPSLGVALAAGLGHCPQARGWLLWASHAPMVQAATLCAVARALEHQPLVRAHYQGIGGQPLGFAAEFYSDLMRLRADDDLQRMLARFPADPVEVDDPGVTLDVADLPRMLQAPASWPALDRPQGEGPAGGVR